MTSDEKFLSDIRAEILAANIIEAAEWLQKDIAVDDFVIQPIGVFKRGYCSDVVECKEKISEHQPRHNFHFQVNRDGLYDHLPEGLFHEHHTIQPGKNIEKSKANIEKKKSEETDARRFFLPFEQAFYYQLLSLELDERKYLKGYVDKYLLNLFLKFWGLSSYKFSDESKAAVLLYLLPFSYIFAGNLAMIESCLSLILGVDASVKYSRPRAEIVADKFSPVLGDTTLGVDFVLGESLNEGIRSIEIELGPLSKEHILNYLPHGSELKILDVLCDFFIPVGLDIKLKLIIADEEKNFLLTEQEQCSRLGYTTFI